MNEQEFVDIFDNDDLAAGALVDFEGDNALAGLLIIHKYLPEQDAIQGVGHEAIYSVDVSDIVEAGITRRDAERLVYLNWMIEDGAYLACFV